MAPAFDIERESLRLDAEKPYVEVVDGIELVKPPKMISHAALQRAMGSLLAEHAGDRAIVGTELRVWLDTGDRPVSLVPDVAVVDRARMRGLAGADRNWPRFAPEVVVEIRSPSARERNVARKIALYLAHGTRLVLDVDRRRETIVAHDGKGVRSFGIGDGFEHEAVPGLSFSLDAFFAAGRLD